MANIKRGGQPPPRNGSVLIGMKIGTGSSAKVLRFSYDASGNVVAVDYSTNNGSSFTTYYYLRNAQNDIVKIVDNSGSTKVEYIYDSWGTILSVTGSLANTVGADQPFRYRGYVYDTETQWYYLQSRYYNPAACRFISADVLLSTGQGVLGHNSFAYCLNNPVNGFDSNGCCFCPNNVMVADDCSNKRTLSRKSQDCISAILETVGLTFDDFAMVSDYYQYLLAKDIVFMEATDNGVQSIDGPTDSRKIGALISVGLFAVGFISGNPYVTAGLTAISIIGFVATGYVSAVDGSSQNTLPDGDYRSFSITTVYRDKHFPDVFVYEVATFYVGTTPNQPRIMLYSVNSFYSDCFIPQYLQ